MNDLVSVIITTYKRTEELRKALHSVYSQTYKSLEVIIVDDNIEEMYSEIVKKIILEYSSKIKIIYVKNKKNLGGALSRNEGIKLANGEYISFLDDDDEYYPNKIEKQIDIFKKTKFKKLALVYCYTVSVDNNDNIIKTYKNDVRGTFLFEAMYDCIAATSQWMCLKKALIDVGGFSKVPSKQDSTVLFKLALKGYEIDRVPEILTKYYELDIERISSGGKKNIEGEIILRNRLRENYGKLSKNQARLVEYNSSKRIFWLLVKNNLYFNAYKELFNMYKHNFFSAYNLKMLAFLIYNQSINKNN